jgi:hypothetical protein
MMAQSGACAQKEEYTWFAAGGTWRRQRENLVNFERRLRVTG